MGYAETRPPVAASTGYIRISDGPALPNRKLARVPNPTPDEPNRVHVLFETRGEGGWVVTAPSERHHPPNGGAWQVITGGRTPSPPSAPTTGTAVYAVLAMFDQMPVDNGPARPGAAAPGSIDGRRPAMSSTHSIDWADILDGWTGCGHGRRLRVAATRQERRHQATTGQADDADRLYVFTTATPLPAKRR
jgi:putative DNA primase/helicase